MQPLTQSIHSKNIQFSETGQGFPVVFIHGFGEDERIWNSIIDSLKSICNCISIQLPGSGNSPSLKTATSMENLAHVVMSTLKKAGLEKFVVLGHSMGGYIALAMLEYFPSNIFGLGLIHSTAFADSDEKKTIREKLIQFIRNHGTSAFFQTSIPDLYKDKKTNQYFIEQQIRIAEKHEPDSLCHYTEAMLHRPDRSLLLCSSNVPVLIVCGAFDKAVPLEQSLKQSSLPKECHFHIMRQSAHMSMHEETNALTQIVTNYITYILKSK